MITHAPVKWFLICLFIISELARAAQPATQPTNLLNNAAARYWTAFHFLPDDLAVEKILSNWSNAPLNAEATHVIDAGRISLYFFGQGAALTKCDWGCDYSKGWQMLLPQLGKGRELAQLACLRARAEFQQHHFTEAADDLVNTIALAEHLSTDKTMIGSLVRDRIEQIAIENLTPHLQQLDKVALDHLAERMAKLPIGSTFVEIIEVESHIGLDWIVQRAQNAAAVGEPMDWTPIRDDLGANAQSVLASVENATPEEIIADAQALRPYYVSAQQLIQTSTDQHQTEDVLKILFKQYASKPLENIFLSDLSRSFNSYAAGRTSLLLLQAAIAVTRQGPQQAKNFIDPINHQPLDYHAIPSGFELVSTVIRRGRPISMHVITAPIQ